MATHSRRRPPETAVGRRLDLEGLRSVVLRPARVEDATAMVGLHAQVLSTAFLPLLGERFLRRLFLAQIEDPDSVSVVAERDGEVIGYASGVVSVPAFRRRFVRRHGVRAALAAAPRLIRPKILRRVVETFSYPEVTRGLPEAEWAFVGIKRGTAPGLGEELGREVLAGLAERGASEVKGYVSQENRAMNSLLRRMGFELRSQLSLHEGRPHNVYVFRCPPPERDVGGDAPRREGGMPHDRARR